MRKSIYQEDYVVLVALMREMREELGKTQEAVAADLGITASQLSKWERRERRVDISELRLYCKSIGIELSTLIEAWEAELRTGRGTGHLTKPKPRRKR